MTVTVRPVEWNKLRGVASVVVEDHPTVMSMRISADYGDLRDRSPYNKACGVTVVRFKTPEDAQNYLKANEVKDNSGPRKLDDVTLDFGATWSLSAVLKKIGRFDAEATKQLTDFADENAALRKQAVDSWPSQQRAAMRGGVRR